MLVLKQIQAVARYQSLIYISSVIVIAIFWGVGACTPLKQTRKNYQIQSGQLPVKLMWQFTAIEDLLAPAIIHDDRAVYLRTPSVIYALDPLDGRVQWQREIATSADLAPVTNDQHLYLPHAWRFELEALDGTTGETKWRFDPSQYTSARAGRPQITALVADQAGVYVVVNLRRGTDIFLLDSNSGQVLAQAPPALAEGESAPGAFFVNSSWVFVEEYGSWLLSKDLKRVIRRLPNEINSYRPPTFATATTYTSGQVVEAIELPSWQIEWQFTDDCLQPWDQVPVSPLVVGQSVYVTTTCNQLYKLHATDGSIAWQYESATAIYSFVQLGEFGYFVSSDASLQAVDLSNGTPIGKLHVNPPVLMQPSYQHLAASDTILVVTYGNQQAFAFQAK